jgi:aspartate aminotransferase/aminotransferase
MRGSGIRQIMNLALTMEGVLHVEVGEPDFPTPAHIVAAAHQAALEGYTRYTANAGLLSLREALAAKIERFNGLRVTPDHITVSSGAVSALMVAMAALVEAGDEVLLPDPGWPNYEMMVRTLGAAPVHYRLEPQRGFLPDLNLIEHRITSHTKAIIVNSPSNPTGAVFPEDTVADLVHLAEIHDLWVISDEVYEQIIFEGVHISPARFDHDGRVISVFSFSKAYAMTGWRVGYMVTPPLVTDVANRLQEPFISCACAVSQKAAEAAILGPQDCVEQMRLAYQQRRDLVVSLLKEYGMFTYIPHGAFYAMVDISRATEDSYDFAQHMLLAHRVAVAPGETFGPSGRGLIRISLCTGKETLAGAVAAIAQELCAEDCCPRR